MKVTLSVFPHHSPMLTEQVEKLPVKPDEVHRKMVRWHREVNSDDEFDDLIRNFLSAAQCIRDAFDNTFELSVYIPPNSTPIIISHETLKLLAEAECGFDANGANYPLLIHLCIGYDKI